MGVRQVRWVLAGMLLLICLGAWGPAQAAETVTLKATEKAFKYNGASGSISYSVSGGAPNTEVIVAASTEASWIHIDAAYQGRTVKLNKKGTGKGSVKYRVDKYELSQPSPRTGTIQIADQQFAVSQTGAPCKVTLEPTSSKYPAEGDNGLFTVHAPGGCEWTATVDAKAESWIAIEGAASWAGEGSVAFTVAENGTSKSRSGKIYVTASGNASGKKTHSVKQSKGTPPQHFAALNGTMITPRTGYTATLLPNGKILVAGGSADNETETCYATAELYDPTAQTWSTTGSMNEARGWHSAILLPNGKVLVAGGQDNGDALSSAELYDPAAGTWSYTGYMIAGRSGAAPMVLLGNGKVLTAGGHGGGTLSSAELYNPATGTWSATGSMGTARRSNPMTLLEGGKVLVAGGRIKEPATVHSSAELYDPSTGFWSPTASMSSPRTVHTATLLPNGKVLVAGGSNATNPHLVTSAELYDPTNGTWTDTGSMTKAGVGGAAALLEDGNVLVVGGWNGSKVIANTQLYHSATGTWSDAGSMTAARLMPDAIRLPDGNILILGGIRNMQGTPVTSVELYTP